MIRKVKSQKSKVKSSRTVLILFTALLSIVVIYFFVKELSFSFLFNKKDRINMVFYGKNTVFYSLGLRDNIHYFISFFPDIKVKVPGGYGSYRVGGLGKLVSLEKKSDILRKTFSVTTASCVDRYFYQNKDAIYYGKDEVNEDTLSLPGPNDILFTSSNSNIIDRLYIFYLFFGKQKRQFSEIDYKRDLGVDEEFFQDKDFAKKYQGFLYNSIYRKEQKTIQIIYGNSYKTALFLSKVLEGDGIRVVDLKESTGDKSKNCTVIEGGTNFSVSSINIASYFKCNLIHGMVESSDIIIKLGNLEKEWEIL